MQLEQQYGEADEVAALRQFEQYVMIFNYPVQKQKYLHMLVTRHRISGILHTRAARQNSQTQRTSTLTPTPRPTLSGNVRAFSHFLPAFMGSAGKADERAGAPTLYIVKAELTAPRPSESSGHRYAVVEANDVIMTPWVYVGASSLVS
jgi:hypothetical protein